MTLPQPLPSDKGPYAHTGGHYKSSGHFATIDALRGIAALAVCLFHIGGPAIPKISTPQTAVATAWGAHGVDIFFVISGIVIPYVMLRGRYVWLNGPRFLARRIFRVAPPAYILLILTIAQFWFVDRLVGGDRWFGELTAHGLIANFSFLVPFMHEQWLNGVFWTLAIEFQYYFILSLIFPLVSRSCLAAVCVWLLLASASSLTPGVTDFFDYVGCFILGGIVLAHKERALSIAGLTSAATATLALIEIEQGWLSMAFAGSAALAIAFTTIDNRVLNFLGKISYSLYLTHIIASSTAEFFLLKFYIPRDQAERLSLQFICLGVALLVATIFYYVVERHFVELSRKVRSQPQNLLASG